MSKPSTRRSSEMYTLAERRVQRRYCIEEYGSTHKLSGSRNCIRFVKRQLNRAERRHGKALAKAAL